MPTTTIRLPQALKDRIARAAERAGTTPHGFILEAIAEKTEQEERCAQFQDEAERRYAEIVASGKTVPWPEMRRYLERRLTTGRLPRPKPRVLTR
jgi:predicted transcriptional regulator